MLLHLRFVFAVAMIFLMSGVQSLVRQCEPIRMEICRGLGYNLTAMPNLGGNEYQEEAEFYLKTFQPLINFGCSPQLNLFLCSVYVPMCTEKVSHPIGPCRGLCEGVRDLCFPVLEKFGFPWPETLNCTKFPIENNQEHMCMEGPKNMMVSSSGRGSHVDNSLRTHDCPPNHARNDASGPCIPLYDPNFLFDDNEKNFAEVWITVWATISFISSLFAALTLSIGGGRVKARPLVSLALCYCLVSVGWITRVITGRKAGSCLPNENAQDFHEDDGLTNANCAIVFLMIYYFGMAANAWWVALCAWWVAKAGLSWPSEKLRNLGSCLHIAAWGFPAIQTVGALVKREIDTDELTGTCYIGNKNSGILLGLVLLPQSLYLISGVTLLAIGSIYVMKKPQTVSAAPLTGAAPRKESDILGGLSTLYIIPTACVLASICYEYNNRDDWFRGTEKPALWAFLLKHLMSLFVGVSTIFWLWSKKTIAAWRNVCKRLGPRKQIAVKCQMPLVVTHPPQISHISSTMTTSSRHSSRSHPHRKPRMPQQHHQHQRTLKTII
ncbi:frizzled-4-like [Onthophagus taurus]|uniref:frizzled-4-like n=1 Tax=Onthophagus taurus TaxID=166361 RepID=UPI000C20042B|nr:frizzled-4-like [Onthophagus taurus]